MLDQVANPTYTKIALINELARSSDIGARNLRNAVLAASPEDTRKFIDVITKNRKNATEWNNALAKRMALPREKDLYKAMDGRSSEAEAAHHGQSSGR